MSRTSEENAEGPGVSETRLRQKLEISPTQGPARTATTVPSESLPGEEKIFNDPIHGHIELHPLMVRFMDTPQFQRLRYIKQLGGCYYVFPGASHNRFEHSIGVGYLAGEMVETLQRKQPELDISEVDVLCVKLAGLCHDLGHGPFSHLFDKRFIPKVSTAKWKHEDASVMMFRHLIDENHLMEEMKKYKLDETDQTFIEELIAGKELASSSDWPYKGRTKEKCFLYEIVANKRTGVDVDKWDYFARDCHHLGISRSFDLWRCMKFARVIESDVDGMLQISTRDKEVTNLYEMFHTRSTLHREAYQHKTTNVIELMITEALVAANDHLMIPGKDGKLVKMSEAIDDPFAYTRLTDHVLQQIQLSTELGLKEAQKILERIERRKLYKYVGFMWLTESNLPEKGWNLESEMIDCLPAEKLHGLPVLVKDNIVVEIVTFNYGMKSENPINKMTFYVKNDLQETIQVDQHQVSQMLPQIFQEKQIRMYCKKDDKDSFESAKMYFDAWYKKISGSTPEGTLTTKYFARCAELRPSQSDSKARRKLKL